MKDLARLLSGRAGAIPYSGIRRFFDLASKLKDPCDLSIGMPDYDAPEAMKEAAISAIRAGKNRYTPSAGLGDLRERIATDLRAEFSFGGSVMVTAGVSGGLSLALLSLLNPGDEVVFCDPHFVSYSHLVEMFGGRAVRVSCYPDFSFDAGAIERAMSGRTKAIIINSPGNPTGRVMSEAEVRAASELARRRGILLISDEIYDRLSYDGPNPSPMRHAPEQTLLLRGFGKTFGITGWRMGYAAGPEAIISAMTKFQQYTFVCAPSMAQEAVAKAMDADVSGHVRAYSAKRDLVCRLLSPRFEFVRPGGGFYVFPKAPERFGSATAFCEAAVERGVIVIPGGIFSERDTHFRISYATSDAMIERGCGVLCELAGG